MHTLKNVMLLRVHTSDPVLRRLAPRQEDDASGASLRYSVNHLLCELLPALTLM
jgi:hypothetical protein